MEYQKSERFFCIAADIEQIKYFLHGKCYKNDAANITIFYQILIFTFLIIGIMIFCSTWSLAIEYYIFQLINFANVVIY